MQAIKKLAGSRADALCCECGNLRTVSTDYRRVSDPNYSYNAVGGRATNGWRHTQTLKCDACGERTRHALIKPSGGPSDPDWDERCQRYVLGGEWEGKYPPDRERLRAEYFAQFPRNPELRHRYWINEAQTAWDAGHRAVTAVCGATMPLQRDPRSICDQESSPTELERPAEIDWETEFEDPETDMWWIDMQCVDCLRVANECRQANRRRLLEALLAWFAQHPETISDADADALMLVFGPLAATLREEK
ncbi:hypothetical protein [Mycolicibacterium parafortuitum]|uniref:hypothetical protein n=1 Tax=Mycolicibacterium parafortuitum TaxID=39692 RepID=UPI0009F4FE25|nr:hypothetical protein [Mycolicibacterium parafortuitum]ORB26617.1 hypothetical protein BST38_25475 [Mycolicibacterium parafortuitum]